MLIEKVIEVAIDVKDPIALYTGDSDAAILQLMVEKYEGRCIAACYVQKVIKVVGTGECVMTRSGSPNYGVLPVRIHVLAVVLTVGEVITGCEIVKKMPKDRTLICKTPIISLIVTYPQSYEAAIPGNIIPVRVTAARYQISQPQIVCAGEPYLPSDMPPVYLLAGECDATMLNVMAEDVIARIADEESRRDGINAKSRAVFEKLLHPKRAGGDVPAGVKTVSLLNAVKSGNLPPRGYLHRGPEIARTTDQVYWTESIPADAPTVVTNMYPENVILALLEDYYGGLKMLREMVETYNTEKLITEHSNIWQIFAKSKL